jgi:hypothetical protein
MEAKECFVLIFLRDRFLQTASVSVSSLTLSVVEELTTDVALEGAAAFDACSHTPSHKFAGLQFLC